MFFNSKMSSNFCSRTSTRSHGKQWAKSELWRELAVKCEEQKKKNLSAFDSNQQPKSTKDQPQTTCLPYFILLFCNIKHQHKFHFVLNKMSSWILEFPIVRAWKLLFFFDCFTLIPSSISCHCCFLSAKSSSSCSVNISAPIKKLFSSFSSTSPLFLPRVKAEISQWKSNEGWRKHANIHDFNNKMFRILLLHLFYIFNFHILVPPLLQSHVLMEFASYATYADEKFHKYLSFTTSSCRFRFNLI